MPRATPLVKWVFGVLAATVVLAARPALAAPAEEALRLVPPDAAICLVVRDLRTHVATMAASPFAAWVESSGFLKQFADPTELKKLHQVASMLAVQLGISPEQLLGDVLGDAVVFAYQPGPVGRPQEESGLVLVRARNPDVLAGLVAKVNDLQRSSGEVRAIHERSHRGQTYFEREKAAGREFYLTLDGVFAYSGQEAVIRAVIDRGLDAPRGDPGPVATGLRRLGLTDAPAACWFNPRGFDAALRSRASVMTNPSEQAFLNQFSKVWSATEGVALYVRPGRGVEVGLAAAVDESRLPSELLPLLFPSSGGSALWSVIPDDAILAVGGRINWPRLLVGIGSFLPDSGKADLTAAIRNGLGPLVGKDRLRGVLAGLGPEWVLWVTPPARTGTDRAPGGAIVVKLGATEKQTADLARALLPALDFAAQMARFTYNREHTDQAELSEETRDGVGVKFLANPKGFPAGVRPAYAVKQGYLMVTSSPEVVHRFVAPGDASLPDVPVVRLSARHLRAYLAAHRQPLAAVLATTGAKPTATVEKELEQFSQVLEAVERVEVRYSGIDGQVKLSVNIDLIRSLAK